MVAKTFKFIDLTQTLESSIPTWNGSCGFETAIKMDYEQGCRVQSVKMHAGIGTHLDAPAHFFKDGYHAADIPLEQLIVNAAIIDVSHKVEVAYNNKNDYFISLEDIHQYEEQYGMIPPQSIVIGQTGWSRYWQEPNLYRNEDENGNMHFPGFSKEAIAFLLARDIVGIGIDTLSPDGSDMTFPVHKMLLGHDKYIIENLRSLEEVPKIDVIIAALPLKIHQGTEAALRVVALCKRQPQQT